MEELIKEMKNFRTTIDDKDYSCYIRTFSYYKPLTIIALNHYLVIYRIKRISLFNITIAIIRLWEYEYLITTTRFSFNNEIKKFNIEKINFDKFISFDEKAILDEFEKFVTLKGLDNEEITYGREKLNQQLKIN